MCFCNCRSELLTQDKIKFFIVSNYFITINQSGLVTFSTISVEAKPRRENKDC